jgi:hypothetical protein
LHTNTSTYILATRLEGHFVTATLFKENRADRFIVGLFNEANNSADHIVLDDMLNRK